MKRFILIIGTICLLSIPALAANKVYVASIHPLAAILNELTLGRATVQQLIPSGASPHTYEPKPSDIRTVQSGEAFFYVSPLLDGWASKLPAKQKIEVIELVPANMRYKTLEGHHHEGHGHEAGHNGDESDPHFWTDPLTVKALVPSLVKELTRLDPDGSRVYKNNANNFSDKLDEQHQAMTKQLASVKGKALFMFHPSFQYLMKRYGLVLGGVIEPSPGKEPSPRYIQQMVKQIKTKKATAIFTEPQLPQRPAQILAESAKVTVYTLDPIGGIKGRQSYFELLNYNTLVLQKALSTKTK